MTEEAKPATKTRAAATKDTRTVVERIIAIAEEVGVLEPTKSGGVPFAFRGVDAVVASLTPHLKKHGVIVVPTEVNHILTQRDVGNKVVTKAEVEVTYRFYGAGGDFIEAKVPGQADDFADRSTAQAMSVAFRILLLQTFHIAAFGNEEAASEETKNARESAATAKVDQARGGAAPKPTGAEAVRKVIVAEGGKKGIDGSALTAFGNEVTGSDNLDDWWDDVDKLNAILKALREKEAA